MKITEKSCDNSANKVSSDEVFVRYLCHRDFVKGEPHTLQQLKPRAPQGIAISAITLMEIEYGLSLKPEKAAKIGTVIRELLAAAITCLPCGEKEGHIAGQVRSGLRPKGIAIGAYDVLIAATTLAHNLTAATSNLKEFSRITSLAMANWRQSSAEVA